MGNNFFSKYELFRNVKADDKKGLNINYGIFLVLRRKTGLPFMWRGSAFTRKFLAFSIRERVYILKQMPRCRNILHIC